MLVARSIFLQSFLLLLFALIVFVPALRKALRRDASSAPC